jgi:YVTN family beta-propeller protein
MKEKNILSMVCLLAGIVLAGVTGCSKDDPVTPPKETPATTKGVYVVNEGNSGKNNSTITFYVPDSNKVYQDIFASVNNRPLGDTGNDIVIYKDRIYIVVQQSQKMEVLSALDQKSIGTIQLQGSKSPAKVYIFNDAKGYVTNLYDKSVTVFNPMTLEIIKDRIVVGLYPSGLTAAANKIYVCNSGWGADSTVSVIDAATDAVIKTIAVERQPSEIMLASNGELVVKCDGYTDWGNSANNLPGGLVMIDPSTDAVSGSISVSLEKNGFPGHMALSADGTGYLQTTKGIVPFHSVSRTLDTVAVVSSQSIYSFTLDDVKGRLYVTDAKDYSMGGQVSVFDRQGAKITSFQAGIIPGAIAFRR